MFTTENEIGQLYDENFNQKVLANSGIQLYFENVFLPVEGQKLPVIKSKLRKILVDFGMCQTCIEIDQKLNFIKVWYRDLQAEDLKGLLLQRFNNREHKYSQAIEVSINLEGSLVFPPKISRGVKTYTGLTKLIYQEFIQSTESNSMIDDSPYNEMKEIIRKGNFAPTVPLESIFRGELG